MRLCYERSLSETHPKPIPYRNGPRTPAFVEMREGDLKTEVPGDRDVVVPLTLACANELEHEARGRETQTLGAREERHGADFRSAPFRRRHTTAKMPV